MPSKAAMPELPESLIPQLGFSHVLTTQQFGHHQELLPQLFALADRCAQLDQNWQGRRHLQTLLAGGRAYSLFAQNSTRTQWSLETAAAALGMEVHGGSLMFSSMNKGESFTQTGLMAQAYGADVIFSRHPLDESAQEMAEAVSVPVINAGSGGRDHPTQSLGDAYTIHKLLGRLDHLKLLVVGHGRTLRSLVYLVSRWEGAQIRSIAPHGLELGHDDMPDDSILDYMHRHSVNYAQVSDLKAAMRWADVVYWTRIQRDMMAPHLKARYPQLASQFQLTRQLINTLPEHAGVMHPLPIVEPDTHDKDGTPLVPEVTPGLHNHPKAWWNRQAAYAYHMRIALLLSMLWRSPRRS